MYVSDSLGNDAYNGLCPEFNGTCGPKKTINAGKSLIRISQPDWLLLRRGDVFIEQRIDPANGMNGLNNNEPAIIGAYGNVSIERPILNLASNTGCFYSGMRNNFVLQDIICSGDSHFSPYGTGIIFVGGPSTSQNITLQGLKITGHTAGLSFDGFTSNFSNIEINRIVINKNWYNGTNKQTIYTAGTLNVTLREVTFDQTAWNSSNYTTRTFLDHLFYQNQADLGTITVLDSIFSRGPDSQFRYGSILKNNHWVNTTQGAMTARVADSPIIFEENVIMLGDPIIIYNGFIPNQSHAKFGEGLSIGRLLGSSQSIFKKNIIAHKQTHSNDSFGPAIKLSSDLNNTLIENNIIYNWYNQGLTGQSFSNGSGNIIRENIIQEPYAHLYQSLCFHCGLISLQGNSTNFLNKVYFYNNTYYSSNINQEYNLDYTLVNFTTWKSNYEPTAKNELVEFVDPNRTTATYALSVGYPNLASFLDDVVEERRGRWNDNLHAPAINNYIRGGFTQLSETCSLGMNQSCLNQQGVCFGSYQMCSNNIWPGCNYSSITNYQSIETSCDSLDNDCDGVVDEECSGPQGTASGSNGAGSGISGGSSGGGSGGGNSGSSNGSTSSGNTLRNQCSDGIDNDGDNLIDYPQDLGCSNNQDNIELNEKILEGQKESEESSTELNSKNKDLQIGVIFWFVLTALTITIGLVGIKILRKIKNKRQLESKIKTYYS